MKISSLKINFLKKLQLFNIAIIKKQSLILLNKSLRWYSLRNIIELSQVNNKNILNYIKLSESQFLQDLFVLAIAKNTRKGFFVEFGATDGKTYSNTYMLEKYLDWNGILCEPSKQFKDILIKNRNSKIDFRCVSEKKGQIVEFTEIKGTGLSSITKKELNLNKFKNIFYNKIKYKVDTISLTDLLVQNNAPINIDYLSIDVEGTEYDILKNHNWELFNIDIITVEHNFSPTRQKIFNLLISKGYERLLSDVSYVDDWYVHERIIKYLNV